MGLIDWCLLEYGAGLYGVVGDGAQLHAAPLSPDPEPGEPLRLHTCHRAIKRTHDKCNGTQVPPPPYSESNADILPPAPPPQSINSY